MTLTLVFAAGYVAFAYAAWSIIGKFSGASGAWVGTIVMVVSIAFVIVFGAREMAQGPTPSLRALALLVFASALNGYAIQVHTSRAVDPQVPTGLFVTTIFALMIVFAPLLSWLLNGEQLTVYRIAGILTIILGIVIMSL